MKVTAILIITLLFTSSLSIEMQAEERKSPEQVLLQLKDSRWGKLALSLLEMQLKTDGPLDELIVAFKNLWENLTFKIQEENKDYRRMKQEHMKLKAEIGERQADAQVRVGVSNFKLQNTLYPDRDTMQATIDDAVALIAQTEQTIANAGKERAASQAIYEEESGKLMDAIDALNECIALVQGLQQGTPSLISIGYAKKNAKQLLSNLKIKNNPALTMVKTLFELTQDFANKADTQKVLDLLLELLPDFQEQLHMLTVANDAEIEMYQKVLTAQNDILADAKTRKLNAEKELEAINAMIAEEVKRLETAQNDLDRANADFDGEMARWGGEEAAHLDLLAELESELEALNQCIDLFSSDEMAQVSDGMLDKLNEL